MKTDGEANAMGKKYRGGTDVYGESIYTKRWNYWVLMNFLLQKKMLFSFSYTDHDQNSIYGYAIPRKQRIGFGQ
jgi:outer membrane receptor for ferrienterochelin and colicins